MKCWTASRSCSRVRTGLSIVRQRRTRCRRTHLLISFSVALFCVVFLLGICSRKIEGDNDACLLIGYADGYPVHIVMPLISSFHAFTPQSCLLVVFMRVSHTDQIQMFKNYGRVVIVDPSDVAVLEPRSSQLKEHPAFYRYFVIQSWLRPRSPQFARIIMADLRDTALFDNPFKQLLANGDAIQSFTEIKTYREEEIYNQKWIRNCYGPDFLHSILHEPITCCGVIASSGRGMMQYLDAFTAEMLRKHGCDGVGLDTAVHVWISHKILKNVSFVDYEHALIRHSPAWDDDEQPGRELSYKFDTVGRLLNSRGEPFAMIHQADRLPAIWKPFVKYNDIGVVDQKYLSCPLPQQSRNQQRYELADHPEYREQNTESLWQWHTTISKALPVELDARRLRLREDAVIVDLGGNVGAFSETITAKCSDCTVYVVEALPEMARFIKHNNPQFHVYNFALSGPATTSADLTIWRHKNNLGWNTMFSEKTTPDMTELSVPAASFDDVFCLPRIDVLKIDIEGSESACLSGMHRTLSRLPCLPDIVLEIGWGTLHPDVSQLRRELDFLSILGYPKITLENHTMDVWWEGTCF